LGRSDEQRLLYVSVRCQLEVRSSARRIDEMKPAMEIEKVCIDA